MSWDLFLHRMHTSGAMLIANARSGRTMIFIMSKRSFQTKGYLHTIEISNKFTGLEASSVNSIVQLFSKFSNNCSSSVNSIVQWLHFFRLRHSKRIEENYSTRLVNWIRWGIRLAWYAKWVLWLRPLLERVFGTQNTVHDVFFVWVALCLRCWRQSKSIRNFGVKFVGLIVAGCSCWFSRDFQSSTKLLGV